MNQIFILSKFTKVFSCMILATSFFLVGFVNTATAAIEEATERTESGLKNAAATSFYPALRQLWVRVDFDRKVVRFKEAMEVGAQAKEVRLDIVAKDDGKTVASATFPLPESLKKDLLIETPDLAGVYDLVISFVKADGSGYRVHQPLERRKFPWEGNKLGISESVPRPFIPVKVDGSTVEVVLRTYTINEFGLMDRIVADGREILAASMSITFALPDGKAGAWISKSVKAESNTETTARFVSHLVAPELTIETRTTVEYDGVAKVEMTLKPGKTSAPISSLWIDIPLNNAEVPLYHTYVDRNRINPSAYVPQGEGVVWTSNDAPRSGAWRNSFTPYIWVGAEGPGLAWFGENDRGYFTEKGGSKKPIQELIRKGEQLILRVYLVNKEVTIKAPSSLVFGIQATPTKPMPENWRSIIAPGMPGPVVPWGGLTCSDKFPYQDDWTVVDKILEGRKTGKADLEWFKAWAAKNDPPMIHGHRSWLEYNMGFANRAIGADKQPLLVYFEEMRASKLRPEWGTFAAEWAADPYPDRTVLPMDVMRRGFYTTPMAAVTYPDSYIDCGIFYADEWLKRGVSLYWDNTYPMVSYNTRMTAAYETEDGKIQPATVLWQQREYMRRMFNRLVYWQDHQDQPLQWSTHFTNTLIAPLHTYSTTVLDLEWGRDDVFPPEFLRTETIGRQIGAIPHSLYAISGTNNHHLDNASKETKERVEWGMRAVHDIRSGEGPNTPDGKPLRPAFGYGAKEVVVHNYWERNPVIAVSNPEVFWVVYERPADKAALIILQSYKFEDTKAEVTLGSKLAIGDGPFRDAESGGKLPVVKGRVIPVELPGPYGTKVLSIGKWEPIPEKVVTSGFIHWPDLSKKTSETP